MEDVKGLLEKMVIAQLSKEEIVHFNEIMEERMKTNDRTNYDIWLAPRLMMLESKYKMEALDKVLQKKYYAYYSNVIEDLTADETAGVLPVLSKMKQKQDSEEEIKNSDYVFITISPELGSSYMECIKYTERVMKLKFVKKYLYVLEQRYNGIPNEKYKKIGDGLHLHYLLHKSDYKRSHIIRDIKRCFGTMNINIDFKFIKESDLLKVQTYMVGQKSDADKQIKQEYDKEYRKNFDIKDYYGELYIC